MEIRKHFLSKYGKEFITAALEVRPECGVSRMVGFKLLLHVFSVHVCMCFGSGLVLGRG